MLEETRKIVRNPLYKQIEQRFNEDEESEIEKRKRHLQSLRDLRQPLNHDEIQEHAKKMDEIVKEKAERRKQDRLASSVNASYDPSKYHTRFLDNVLEQEAAWQEEKERKEEERQRI
jgi:hypothetical protein